MPYKSKAQQAKFHEMLDQGQISPATVKEFDEASKGLNLPERTKQASPAVPSSRISRDLARRKQFWH